MIQKHSPPCRSFEILSSQDIYVTVCERSRKEEKSVCMEKVVGFGWVSFHADQLNENCKIKYTGARGMTESGKQTSA